MRYTDSDIGRVKYTVVEDIELNGFQFESGDVVTLSDITEKGGAVMYTLSKGAGSFTITSYELEKASEFEKL